MARKIISEHSLAPSLKPGRRLAVGFLEGALLSLLSLFCFVLVGYADGVIPFYKEHSSNASAYQSQMVSLICESGAGESNGKGELLSYNDRAENYLKNAAYTSLLAHNETPSDLIYGKAKNLTAESDLPYRYLVSFKANNETSFDGGLSSGISSYWDSFEGVKTYFEEGSGYPILKIENAKALNEYFKNGSYAFGSDIAAKLKDGYKKLCKTIVNDFQGHYLPYKQIYVSFASERNAIYLYKIAVALLVHLLSCLIYCFVLPFFLKGNVSLGKRLLKVSLIHRDGTLLTWWERLLHALTIFVETLIVPSLMPLLFYGSGASDLYTRALLGPFSLLALSFVSLVLIIFSYTGCFYLKGKASWSEFIFKGKSVDGREN